jgi:hypothetical protein
MSEVRISSAERLEQGNSFFSRRVLSISPMRTIWFLRSQKLKHASLQSIPFRSGVRTSPWTAAPEQGGMERLAGLMRGFSESASAWLAASFRITPVALRSMRHSLRTEEEAIRSLRHNDVLHIDNFLTALRTVGESCASM